MAIAKKMSTAKNNVPAKAKKKDGAENRLIEFREDEIDQWFSEEEVDTQQDPEIELTQDDISEKYNKSQLRVVRETKDFTLDYLQHALKMDNYIINVAPDYQRRQRWSPKKRSLLIESFLMNIPIPPVFLFEREYNSYEVVDGRQRLDTIREFLDNNFALTGLTYWPELNRKSFKKLPLIIQRGLIRRSIGAIVLLAETRKLEDDDINVRTILFDRLNTGGEKLNPQELRNALYPGRFNKLLLKLARSDEFTSTWGIPPYSKGEDSDVPERLAKNTLYKTMADCELVLRFFSIREALTGTGKGALRTLLDRTMANNQNCSEEQAKKLAKLYQRSLMELKSIFEKGLFVLPGSGKPSRPLYDALMVAHSLGADKWELQPRATIKASISRRLGVRKSYDILVGRGNTLESIRQRVALATEILFGGDGHD